MWLVLKVALGVFIGLYAFVFLIGCIVQYINTCMDSLEHRVYTIKERIKSMYLRLGYNASGTQLLNSQRVEEKSSIAEVDRTTESERETELAALKRALTAKR